MSVSYKVLREQTAKELAGLRAENAQLEAERDRLLNDMQRIYDSCSDVDLIIDIAGAAVDAIKGADSE